MCAGRAASRQQCRRVIAKSHEEKRLRPLEPVNPTVREEHGALCQVDRSIVIADEAPAPGVDALIVPREQSLQRGAAFGAVRIRLGHFHERLVCFQGKRFSRP